MINIRIATRKSPLALWQANHVGELLKKAWPGLDYSLVPLVTSGDKFLKDRLKVLGGKGLFVKELEEALLNNQADIAVHSMKDMPADLPAGLIIAALCQRDNPKDAFISRHYKQVKDLPANARIGTSSLRRKSQLLALRPDLVVDTLRGNIQTRLKRLDDGDFDAIILAAAGLLRMGYQDQISEMLSIDTMLPACAQGALGIECKEDNQALIAYLNPINDPLTDLCVKTERKVNARLGGNCHVPLAVFCYAENEDLHLQAKVLSEDGQTVIHDAAKGAFEDASELAERCATNLLNKGAGVLLEQ